MRNFFAHVYTMKGLLIFLIIFIAVVAIGAVFIWYKRNSMLGNAATESYGAVMGIMNLFKRKP